MQNNEHSESNRFRKFFQEKGYYIVLLAGNPQPGG